MIRQLFFTFFRIGAFTFGGGYAMIPLLDYECVQKRGWITEDEFMDVTVIAESTPGPIAINCATYTGYRKAGIRGAIAATVGVILPSFLLLLLISAFFENLLQYHIVAKAFQGIRVAVAILIVRAGIKLVQQLLQAKTYKAVRAGIAAIYFAAILLMDILGKSISTIYLILLAGAFGFIIFGWILPQREAEQSKDKE